LPDRLRVLAGSGRLSDWHPEGTDQTVRRARLCHRHGHESGRALRFPALPQYPAAGGVGDGGQERAMLCPEVAEEEREALLPYCLYQYRWAIEVIFYEQKTFWSFGNYMVRSRAGIECYVNLLAVVYSAVQLLPYHQKKYAHLRQESRLVKKQLLGTAIQQEVFFVTFALSLEKRLISRALWKSLERWMMQKRNF